MDYHQDDRWLFGLKDEGSRTEWWAVLLLVLLIVGNLALVGCDAESAEVTAKIEQDAHEQKQTVMASWYSHTYRPIKASEANVTVTVCQQTDSTVNWGCYAVAK